MQRIGVGFLLGRLPCRTTLTSANVIHGSTIGGIPVRLFATKRINPYHVLGISPSASYKEVKQKFLELALVSHPDATSNKDTSEQFVKYREAHDMIKRNSGTDATEQSETIYWTEEDFLQWFNEQTGLKLTSEQRREMVNLYRSRIPGGRYDGPSWDLARRLVAYQDAFLKQRQQQHQTRHNHTNKTSFSSKTIASPTKNLRRKRRR